MTGIKPVAIIVDIDGTLAHSTGRDWWDFERVGEDRVDRGVRFITTKLFPHVRIFLVTGRDDTCREQTEKWLLDNTISYDHLLMRDPSLKDGHGNKLADHIVKEDIYRCAIEPRCDVLFVLDDRDSVVDMWRRIGLPCYQVAPGAF